jgi:DNA-binding NarL/FixJ family response regulator
MAVRTSRGRRDVVDALAGRFLSAATLEHPDAERFLSDLADSAHDADERLRAIISKLYFLTVQGRLREEAGALGAVGTRLLHRTHDFRIRSSFLHSWANVLILQGHYSDALGVASRLNEEVEAFGLTFARPHVLLDQVAALWGINQTAQAMHLLRKVDEEVLETDLFVRTVASMLRARVSLSMNLPDDALASTITDPSLGNRAIVAEYLVFRALAQSRLGNFAASEETLEAAQSLSTKMEPVLLAMFVHALNVRHKNGTIQTALLAEACAAVEQAGAFDAFVVAYRSAPEILTALTPIAAEYDTLSGVFERACDIRTATRAGLRLALTRSPTATSTLTPRELEVAALLTRGLSNNQIGRTLFISEKTVKAHLRHVYEKLGVKSRTEAALKLAADPNLGDGSAPDLRL